jgi:mercuric ion binding protein
MKLLIASIMTLLLSAAAFGKDVKADIKVSGMTCSACEVSVKSALTKVKGVKSTEVSHQKGTATVVYDDTQTNEQQLRDAINKTGFKAEPPQERKGQ